MPLRTLIFALLAALLLAAPAARADRPFVDMPLDEARAAAASQEKILVIVGDADWCKPCKRMNDEAFADARVMQWLDRYAIAITIDIDEQQAEAAELRLNSLPAIIVLRQDDELNRSIGLINADALVRFLEGARMGRAPAEQLLSNYRTFINGPNSDNLVTRFQFARDLLEQEQYEVATEAFAWLWTKGVEKDPAFQNVRLRYMPNLMRDLADQFPPARQTLIALRKELEPRLTLENFDIDAIDELVALSIALEDEQPALDRIDEISRRDDGFAMLAEPSRFLFEYLIENQRWPFAGEVLVDPTGRAQRLIPLYDLGYPVQLSVLIHKIGDIYAALLACGRTEEAHEVAMIAFGVADTGATRRRLKQRAQLAGIPFDQAQTWPDPEE